MKPYSHEEHIQHSFDAFCKKVLRNEARSCDCRGTGCFSVYARKMLIDGYVIRLDYSDVKAMTAELQKIGTNINQIAKRVNATGTLYAQDIEDIKGAMAEIWQLQRSILSKAP